ncbi:MAG TPA: hypothetical protein VHX64_01785, partial [Caulobacteraceae bacterium]|nr:hypothetical protein [Caulobacteraceae bacterium]
ARGLWTSAAAAPDRIAILPFTALDGRPDTRAFAAGLSDELQTVLSSNGTQTVSNTDAASLRGADQDRRIGALGVRLIIDGVAQNDGKTLDVRAHVDDAPHHLTLWTVELTGPAAAPTALQAQVGARIIAALNCSSRALRPRGGLADPQTLGLYLRACDQFEAQGTGDDPQAILGFLDGFRQVVARAPDFAPGHSALAKFLAYYRHFLPPDLAPQLAAEADREAHKALTIDPRDADAYIALSMLTPPGEYLKVDQLIGKSLQYDPAWTYPNIFEGGFLESVGRIGEALTYTQRAVAANPLSLDVSSDVLLAWNGQTRAAEAELARLRQLWPTGPLLWGDRLEVYSIAHDWPELKTTLDDPDIRPKTLTDADLSLLRLVAEAAKTRSASALAKARGAILAAPEDSQIQPGQRARFLAWLGFEDDAFSVVDRLSRLPPSAAPNPMLLFSPELATLRRDPRFMTIAARMGLASYWLQSGKWPDFCAQPGLPYDCKAMAAKAVGARPPR